MNINKRNPIMQIVKKYCSVFITIVMTMALLSCSKSDIAKTGEVKNENVSGNGQVVYQGTAMGYNDLINVDVTLDNGIITDVKVKSHNETPGIGGELKDIDGNILTNGGESPISLIPRLIVENNSINIDTVTGATVTCYGIEHAVADAMVKANIRVDAISSATEEKRDDVNSEKLELTDSEKQNLEQYIKRVNFDIKNENINTDVVVAGNDKSAVRLILDELEQISKYLKWVDICKEI